MKTPEPIKSVAAEAPPAVERPVVAAPQAAAKLELLDGDEIIQLSIKPSLWFIPLASAGVLGLVLLLGSASALAMRTGATPVAAMPFQVLACVAAVRLSIAMLQWASRLYVLTNRRVLRFTGVLKIEVAECRLTKIGAVDVRYAWYGRPLRLGTIQMRTGDDQARVVAWDDVARPQELHELLVRAIRKAQTGG
jgi:uncharacterized membrane protein YdbT with pleckstrin-like domain